MSLLRWSHAVFNVHDMGDMIDFYTNVLGFELSDRGPLGPEAGSPEIVFLSQSPDDHHQIAFVSKRAGADAPAALNHMAFRTGSLRDVREIGERLRKDGRAGPLLPLCHGNAWSYYFKDPEGNGLEVFCDTPWHVAQPQGKVWDPKKTDDALLEWTRREFASEPEFGAIDEFYAARAAHLRERAP